MAQNYHLNRVIGDDETGFRGTGDNPYRMEGWDFIVAGGGLYNNLDYSFVAGHEDGSFVLPAGTPGGGNRGFRRSMRALQSFMQRFDFVRMRPDNSVIEGALPAGVTARALVNRGEDYAIYLRTAQLPGQFSARWTGFLVPPVSGTFTLLSLSNDGVRLWLDNTLLIDNWTEHAVTEDQASVTLEAGRRYPLKVEFFYAGGQTAMKLLWSGPGVNRALVPASAFQSPEGQQGLRAEYFADTTLSARSRVTLEPQINIAAPGDDAIAFRFAADELQVGVRLAKGAYRAEWINTRTGEVARSQRLRHDGGVHRFSAPAFVDDIAFAIEAQQSD